MLGMLIDQLASHSAASRIEALCILVMLEEADALDRLAQMAIGESVPEVCEAIRWAEVELRNVRARGYSTEIAMSQAFRQDLMDLKLSDYDLDDHECLGQAKKRNTSEAAKAGTLAARFPLTGLLRKPAINRSARPTIGREPIVPPRPTAKDIRLVLDRLDTPDPGERAAAMVQLRDLNNPLALGSLGKHFISDPDRGVRQVAQFVGKMIYFSALYWQTHDAREATHHRAEPVMIETTLRASAAPSKTFRGTLNPGRSQA